MTAIITHCVSLRFSAKLRPQAGFCGAVLFFCALMSPQKPTVCGVCEIWRFIYDVCTSPSANRILLLEKGQIAEDGTPKKLMNNENSKTYKRLKKYKALFLD